MIKKTKIKNTVTTKKAGDIKEIKIIIENAEGMIIRKNMTTGKVISVTDESGKRNSGIKKAKKGEVMLNGHAVTDVSHGDVVLFTHSSPGCAWYWTGSGWIWRCT
ncbi:MAG: hypothetical protein AB1442_12185 [Nitrospirota bacterium]